MTIASARQRTTVSSWRLITSDRAGATFERPLQCLIVEGASVRRTKLTTDTVLKQLRAFGLAYPGAHTKSPWPGHLDLAVNDKTFAYLSVEGQPFSMSCKLPRSGAEALMLPFTKPTGYGLGKSGWVTAEVADGESPPLDLFKAWIDESYRAQAPKRLVAQLGGDKGASAAPVVGAARRATAAPIAGGQATARPPKARASRRR